MRRAFYRRYAIADEAMLRESAEKLSALHRTEQDAPWRVAPMAGTAQWLGQSTGKVRGPRRLMPKLSCSEVLVLGDDRNESSRGARSEPRAPETLDRRALTMKDPRNDLGHPLVRLRPITLALENCSELWREPANPGLRRRVDTPSGPPSGERSGVGGR